MSKEYKLPAREYKHVNVEVTMYEVLKLVESAYKQHRGVNVGQDLTAEAWALCGVEATKEDRFVMAGLRELKKALIDEVPEEHPACWGVG